MLSWCQWLQTGLTSVPPDCVHHLDVSTKPSNGLDHTPDLQSQLVGGSQAEALGGEIKSSQIRNALFKSQGYSQDGIHQADTRGKQENDTLQHLKVQGDCELIRFEVRELGTWPSCRAIGRKESL